MAGLFASNVSPIDIWTPVHAAFGVGAARFGVRRVPWYLSMALLEFGELLLEDRGLLGVESPANVVIDLAVGALAYELERGRIDRLPVGVVTVEPVNL